MTSSTINSKAHLNSKNIPLCEMNYQMVIPFEVQFGNYNGKRLPALATTIYGWIGQMITNPKNSGIVDITYSAIAKKLHVTRRRVIQVVSILKKLGFVERVQIGWNRFKWVLFGDISPPRAGPRQNEVKLGFTDHKYDLNIKPTVSNFFSKIEEGKLLAQKLSKDERSDREFLADAQCHMQYHSFPANRWKQFKGLLTILKNKYATNEIFEVAGKPKYNKLDNIKSRVTDWVQRDPIIQGAAAVGASAYTQIKRMLR